MTYPVGTFVFQALNWGGSLSVLTTLLQQRSPLGFQVETVAVPGLDQPSTQKAGSMTRDPDMFSFQHMSARSLTVLSRHIHSRVTIEFRLPGLKRPWTETANMAQRHGNRACKHATWSDGSLRSQKEFMERFLLRPSKANRATQMFYGQHESMVHSMSNRIAFSVAKQSKSVGPC